MRSARGGGGRWGSGLPAGHGRPSLQVLGFYSKSKVETLEFNRIHILRTSLWLVPGEQTGRNISKSKETSA